MKRFEGPASMMSRSRVQDVLLSTVKELVHNPAFMDVAIHDDLKTKVRQALSPWRRQHADLGTNFDYPRTV